MRSLLGKLRNQGEAGFHGWGPGNLKERKAKIGEIWKEENNQWLCPSKINVTKFPLPLQNPIPPDLQCPAS
jgi:hypothetical protein